MMCQLYATRAGRALNGVIGSEIIMRGGLNIKLLRPEIVHMCNFINANHF